MVQTYSDNKYIYSVDMMFTYIYFNKPKYEKLKVEDLLYQLEYQGWGDPIKNIKYSAIDVINNKENYMDEYKRILNANLNFPIIVSYDGNIIDGIHRLSKAYLNNIKYIKAYIFDKKLMKKFIIGKSGDWGKVDELKVYHFIILYVERFIK